MRFIPPEISRFWDDGTDFLDVVLTEKVASTPYLRGLLSGLTGCTGGQTERVYANFFQFILDKTTHGYVDEEILMNQSAGLYHADLNFYVSDSQYTRAARVASKYLSPLMLNAVRDRSFKFLPFFDFSKFDGTCPKPAKPIVLNFAVAMSGAAGVLEIFDLMDKAYAGGRDVTLQINTPSDLTVFEQVHQIPDKYKHAVWTRNISYDEWVKWLRSGHIFLFDASEGEISASIVTQQMLRQIGVFHKGRYWQGDYVFPDYPYLYSNPLEGAAILRHLIDNYHSKEVQEVIDKQINFLRIVYAKQGNADALIDKVVETLVRKKLRTIKSVAFRLMEEFTKGKNLISWVELVKHVKESSDKGIQINKTGARYGRSPGVYRDALLLLGFADVGGSGGALFQRVGASIQDLVTMKML
jgi:hypothetical protein